LFQAILIGLITLIAIVAIAIVVILRHQSHDEPRVTSAHPVRSINTVGVGSSGKAHTSRGPRVPSTPTTSSATDDQLRSRFTAMGVLVAAVFGSLGVKLWSMQVIQHASYASKADSNLYTTVYTPAPRGIIYDTSGVALVRNRSSFTVLAEADVANNRDVCLRLSVLLGIPFDVVRSRIKDTSTGAQNNRVVASDASLRNIAFISEHASAFEGVSCETRTVRDYPYGALAAHVLGYTGTVSDDELSSAHDGQDLESGDVVGKSGIEASYENVLAGDHGTRTLLTDADGNVKQIVSETDPTKGNDVFLTIRAPVQRIADQKLRDIVAPNGYLGSGSGTAASIVCLDVRNGEIIAMSNFPTYTPATFIGGISQDIWNDFNTEESHYPLMNRAIAGAYPAASTFKSFSAMAALTDGIANSSSTYNCTGTWTGFGEDYPQKCWLTSGHGTLDLVGGIANSCDVVFYDIAKGFYDAQNTLGDDALQDYIKQYGFGKTLGIDLSGEASGRVPTPEWKADYYKDAPEQAVWQGGDMTNMIIGQGYVLVTPLQIACGYAGIASGKIYKPHLLKEVRNSIGETVISSQPQVLYTPDMKEQDIALVRQGLVDVISVNSNIKSEFSGLSYDVAGKTGTAEVSGKSDYSWFACYGPLDDPRYVCACLTEEGISSAQNSVPICADVLKAAMQYDDGTLDTTMSSVPGNYQTVAYSSSSTSRSD
jgi:penicillin-binding protein 2